MPKWSRPMSDVSTAARRRMAVRPSKHGVAIGSAALAVPEQVVENETVATPLGIDSEWISRRTGVRERRIADEATESVASLGAAAAARALDAAGLDPADVDLLLVATMTADDIMPNAAPLVAGRL